MMCACVRYTTQIYITCIHIHATHTTRNTLQTHTYQRFTCYTQTHTHMSRYAHSHAYPYTYMEGVTSTQGCVIITHTNAYVNTYRIHAYSYTRMHMPRQIRPQSHEATSHKELSAVLIH